MKTPKVSIIVPVYNCEQYVDQCISSLVNQSYRDFEIVIVNDGSTDNSLEICERWRDADSRIKIVTIPNGGVANARNIGLQSAVGEYILFVDGDDMVHQAMMKCMIAHLKPEAIVAVGYTRFHESKCDSNDLVGEFRVLEGKCGKIVQHRQGCYCWGVLYDRKILDKYNIIFNKEMRNLEDVVWNATYFMYVDRMVYIDYPFYKYRFNPTSITSKCVDPLWQAKWQFIAYQEIHREFQKRHDKLFRHTPSKIKNTCIKAMCGEILSYKYSIKEFVDYMQRVCGIQIGSFIRGRYYLLAAVYRLQRKFCE